MMRVQDIHRHDDGSIDFDFYRAQAARLRREQRGKIMRSIWRGAINWALVLMLRADRWRRPVPNRSAVRAGPPTS